MQQNRIIQYNVLNTPWPLPDNSVDCCVTSPPYWGLRDYNNPDQIGLEKTAEGSAAGLGEEAEALSNAAAIVEIAWPRSFRALGASSSLSPGLP